MNRTLVVACMAVALAGCGSSGPARDDAFYRLQAVSGTPEMAVPLDGTVLVSGIASRGFTGGRNIVFWDAARPKITQRYTYHFWVEPPAVLIHDVIV